MTTPTEGRVQSMVTCPWCSEWATLPLDSDKREQECFDPNREGQRHEWQQPLYCESCQRQVPASEFDTDLWEHIGCVSAPASTSVSDD